MNPDEIFRRDRALRGIVQGNLPACRIVEIVYDSQSRGDQTLRVSSTPEEQACQSRQSFRPQNQARSGNAPSSTGCTGSAFATPTFGTPAQSASLPTNGPARPLLRSFSTAATSDALTRRSPSENA